MYGDFSQRQRHAEPNVAGVLYQQGRVFFDSDGNAQTQISTAWQDVAARDAFGADVAAVPAEAPQSLAVASVVASLVAGVFDVTLQPGRCWADGLLVRLEGAGPLVRGATYVGPPVQPAPLPGPPVAGDRDAVVLDVWRESLSAFQIPETLIEPALGGPDTTERLITSFGLKLLRLNPGDNCANIGGRLDDNFAAKGCLSVTLEPMIALGGDCPLVDNGGYTGFEHSLYRIEVAESATDFKWSRFNGGLVGRAEFHPVAGGGTADIKANLQAIVTSGLTQFYLETREFDAYLGHWKTTYGAVVTLDNQNRLVLPAVASFGTAPAAGRDVFIRLWNGLLPIATFTGASQPLEQGIRLHFDPVAAGRYLPGDFWTFTVRADGVANALVPMPPGSPPTLIDHQPPEGVHHHRVVLAEVTYAAGAQVVDDCRHVFQPLSKLKGCCTYRVGDGINSFGDFDRIQDAVDALPPEGGEICLLPGLFAGNVRIVDKTGPIRIHGCGTRSRVVSSPGVGAGLAPVFLLLDSRGVTLEGFAIEALGDAAGVRMENSAADGTVPMRVPLLRDIHLRGLRIIAGEGGAVEADGIQFLEVRGCDLRMRDERGFAPAIFVRGDDMELEHNLVRVRSARQVDDGPTLEMPVNSGRGGIQVGGTSERVRLIDNWIQGGRGNGITLGSVEVDEHGRGRRPWRGWVIDRFDPCNPCKPGDSRQPDPGDDPTVVVTADGPLYDIRIERNRIFDMGMNGIGVAAFFNLALAKEMVSVVRLDILGNEIRRCLARGVAKIDDAMREFMGYGAIQLADVTDCLIRENTLTDNGPSRLAAICGIYVLHAEGIDISANEILDNGRQLPSDDDNADNGARAGIYLQHAVAPLRVARYRQVKYPVAQSQGPPAAKVHDNVVSQPLGQALYAVALGTVSVQGNQFMSHGYLARVRPLSSSFVAATVLIANIGFDMEDNVLLSKYSSGAGMKSQRLAGRGGMSALPTPGFAAGRAGHLTAGGNVMFVNNKVVLETHDANDDLAWTSIAILSLDDIAFEDNQCDCRLVRDVVLANAALLGASTRVSGNRFKEGRPNAGFSAIVFGRPMTTVTANQASHCIYADSSKPLPYLVYDQNLVLWIWFGLAPWTGGSGKEDICMTFPKDKR